MTCSSSKPFNPRVASHLAAFLLLLAWAASAWAQEDRVSFTTTLGESFENAKLVRVEPDGIAISHSRGITKVPLEQLPEEVRARFNLDGANAARYRARQAEAARARAEQDRILRERRLQEEQQAADAKELASKIHADYAWHANGVCFTGRVLFVDQGDVLFQLKTSRALRALSGIPYTGSLHPNGSASAGFSASYPLKNAKPVKSPFTSTNACMRAREPARRKKS